MTVFPFASYATVHQSTARVTVVGELDATTGPHVLHAVLACLAEEPAGVCLQLTGVTFCDCAGLNALLAARAAVLEGGKDFFVEGIGPRLARLLHLLGAEDVLIDRNVPTNAVPAPRSPVGAPARPTTGSVPGESPSGGLLA
ncbi:STAS domain-containing protein [Streptomyces sp. NPDC006552]|uniref:STAS domain-containing protein n=1 Tax=Streptomyces sp. NPDC006552 TaxID=3157179 RepID=UPI0033B3B87F